MLWVPIDERFKGRGFKRNQNDFLFARDASVVQVSLFELKYCVSNMLLGFFVKDSESILVSLLSLNPADNLMIDSEGKWLGDYVPAMFSTYPFRLLDIERNGKKKVIGIVKDEKFIVSENEGEPFFNSEGKYSEGITTMARYLAQKEVSETHTRKACEAINKLGLLVPWKLEYLDGSHETSTKQVLKGLYRIDEEKFKSLGESDIITLERVKALAIIYAHFYSANNIFNLLKKHRNKKVTESEMKRLGDIIFDENVLKELT